MKLAPFFESAVLRFTVGSDKTDHLEFVLDGRPFVKIASPKQGIIPHDMVHFAIECSFPFEGFIQLVFRGHEPGKLMEVMHGFVPKLPPKPPNEYSTNSWLTESLVEAMQALLWSKEATFEGFEYAYSKACEARNISPEPILELDFDRCRKLTSELTIQWMALRAQETLELSFQPRGLPMGKRFAKP